MPTTVKSNMHHEFKRYQSEAEKMERKRRIINAIKDAYLSEIMFNAGDLYLKNKLMDGFLERVNANDLERMTPQEIKTSMLDDFLTTLEANAISFTIAKTTVRIPP